MGVYGFIFNYYANLEKHTLLNTLYLNYHIVGKKSLITRILLAQSSWTSLKHITSLPHDLVIANFEACSLSKNSLKLLLDYLEG